MAENVESGKSVGLPGIAANTLNPINHSSAARPSHLPSVAEGSSRMTSSGVKSSTTALPVAASCTSTSGPSSSAPASTGAAVSIAPSGGIGTNCSSSCSVTANSSTAGSNQPQLSVAVSTSKGKGAASCAEANRSSAGSPSVVTTHPVAAPFRQHHQSHPTSSPPSYSWVQSHQPRPSVSAAGLSYPLDEPDQNIEGAGYNWSARNQATWSGPVPHLVRRVSTSGGNGAGCARYGSLNRRSHNRSSQLQQQQPSSSLRLVNGGLAGGANNGYPSSEEELRSPRHRRLYQQQQQPLLGNGLNGRSDDLASAYYARSGSCGGVSAGYSYGGGGGVGTCCSDSLVTALEDEASTSSFVPDYLVAGADDMNFINNKEMSASGGVAGCGSAAGSFAAGGGRVHFSNSAGGGDDVSLYGTPKEEAGPGPGPANMGGEPKPSFIRNQLQALFQPTDNKLAMKLFGSKKALMKERIRQKAAGHWIIHPCSNFRVDRRCARIRME
ncbi:Potassium/sodium hyperpolarization-activated cyclic nucleotide-gated channel 4-like protein [Daphnia magna]|uniref:Potassium/sodium hyperpolarization-activated cyclic nucleotide-gated channel 4-like protein n=1 Tax=Daphnia magna TaxID=35525 RepID=A0A164ZMW0_9CRUS|nr:Potassium/sodium hyperpolarization-activated cyclic nucleotide-gated channel 4-like protein [Daphnia magna]